MEAPEEVSQDSYQEYQIVHVDCKGEVLEYSTAPGEFWPIVRFRIYLSRSYSYYAYRVCWLNIGSAGTLTLRAGV